MFCNIRCSLCCTVNRRLRIQLIFLYRASIISSREIELCCNRCVSSRHHRPALHVLLAAAGHNLCPIHDHCLLSAILIISIKLRK